MSVNLYNATTDTLKNVAGDIVNPKSVNEMIAPIEDGTASKPYAVGEQFIMNDLLCEATQPIAQGDTMVIGTNCEESEQLSKQVKDINTSLTANGNRFEAGYSSANDEYGFNIGSTFYPIGASSGGGDGVVPLLDFDNAVALTANNYTTTKEGCVIVSGYNSSSGIWNIFINDIKYGGTGNNSGIDSFVLQFIPKGTKLRITNTASTLGAYFVPYTYATVDPTVTVYNGVDVELNYSNPLHKFTVNDSYTATKPCYLVIGDMRASGNVQTYLKVNGTTVACAMEGSGWVAITSGSIFRLSRGDTVTTDSSLHSSYSNIYVLEGSVVSPEVTVFNEAEVELNYTTPLYTFDANNTSYTATKDCWLVGCIGGGSLPELKINNTTIMKAYYSASVFLTQIPVYYKLTAGDVVTLTGYSPNVTYLSVFEGTISGSVGAFKREVQRNYYFVSKNGAPVDIDISSLKDTEEITITVNYALGNSFNSERVSVSTAKTYNAHILEAQTNIGTSITYANGKLQFVASHTTYSVMVWVTFN